MASKLEVDLILAAELSKSTYCRLRNAAARRGWTIEEEVQLMLDHMESYLLDKHFENRSSLPDAAEVERGFIMRRASRPAASDAGTTDAATDSNGAKQTSYAGRFDENGQWRYDSTSNGTCP